MPPVKVTNLSQPGTALLDTWGRTGNRKLQDKICPNCNNSFRPRDRYSRYCSRQCMWANNGGCKTEDTWWVNSRGYIEGRVIAADGSVRRVKQHRYVVEKSLGRRLLPNEDVHHSNGIKTDNRRENLELVTHGEHTRLTNRRPYKRGYSLQLSPEERDARAMRLKRNHRESPDIQQRGLRTKAEGRNVR